MKTCKICSYNEATTTHDVYGVTTDCCSQCDEWHTALEWDDNQSVEAQDLFDNYYWNREVWLSEWELQVTEESEDAIRRCSPTDSVFD